MTINNSIPGQVSDYQLQAIELVASLVPENGKMVEVGSLFGSSSWSWAKNVPESATVYCVDPWKANAGIAPMEKQYGIKYGLEQFLIYTADCPNIVPKQGFSPRDFSDWDEPIDLYYEDAVHTNPILASNLEFWSSKVKENGIICGDDYRPRFPDVRHGAHDLAKQFGRELITVENFWCILPPAETSKEHESVTLLLKELAKTYEQNMLEKGPTVRSYVTKAEAHNTAGTSRSAQISMKVTLDSLSSWPVTESENALTINYRIKSAAESAEVVDSGTLTAGIDALMPDIERELHVEIADIGRFTNDEIVEITLGREDMAEPDYKRLAQFRISEVVSVEESAVSNDIGKTEMKNVVPVVLSGGSGTRLWPQSRESMPKQFVNLIGDKTLFEATLERMTDMEMSSGIVVANEDHRFIVAEQLRTTGNESFSLLLEPCGRNTAPAIAMAALQAQDVNPDAIIFVAPADHLLEVNQEFQAALQQAVELAEKRKIVTFGVTPTSPNTGYGYIKTDSANTNDVADFVEKPDLENAERYVKDGSYLWNSGMFMCAARVYLEELKRLAPAVFEACNAAWKARTHDSIFTRLGVEEFFRCPSDSIDFAIMEKTDHAAVVRLDCSWSDLGTWEGVWDASERDDDGNATSGRAELLNSSGNLVRSEGRLVSLIGCKNLVVIDSGDAVLVADRESSQSVKDMVNLLKRKETTEATSHARVYRPWGNYEGIDLGDRYQVKRIVVQPGEILSLQKHHHRAEHWIVVRGVALVTCDDEEKLVNENESTYIPLGSVHRMENPGKIPLELIEVQSGSYLGEDDIIRIEDKYGRRATDSVESELVESGSGGLDRKKVA